MKNWNIKFGAVAWGLPGGGIYAAKTAHAAGLQGIQLELGSYEEGYPLSQKYVMEGYLEDKESYGLEYPAIVLNDVMNHEFIHGRQTENGKIAYDQIDLAVETACRMKVNRIMIPSFINNLITSEEHIFHTKDALRYACKAAEKKGILILTENALDWKRQIELLKDIGALNLKIHFDTQNFKFNFNLDQCEQLEHLYPFIDSVMHVKDGINNPGEKLLGKGNTDFSEQMKILKNKNFEGWIILENYYNLLPLRDAAQCREQMNLLRKDILTLQTLFS